MKRFVQVLLILAILVLLIMCVLSLMEGKIINSNEEMQLQELIEE